jgi:hypothetical protein
MGEVAMAIRPSESQRYFLEDMQHITCKSNNTEAFYSEQSDQECMLAEESTDSTKTAEVLEEGFMQYG